MFVKARVKDYRSYLRIHKRVTIYYKRDNEYVPIYKVEKSDTDKDYNVTILEDLSYVNHTYTSGANTDRIIFGFDQIESKMKLTDFIMKANFTLGTYIKLDDSKFITKFKRKPKVEKNSNSSVSLKEVDEIFKYYKLDYTIDKSVGIVKFKYIMFNCELYFNKIQDGYGYARIGSIDEKLIKYIKCAKEGSMVSILESLIRSINAELKFGEYKELIYVDNHWNWDWFVDDKIFKRNKRDIKYFQDLFDKYITIETKERLKSLKVKEFIIYKFLNSFDVLVYVPKTGKVKYKFIETKDKHQIKFDAKFNKMLVTGYDKFFNKWQFARILEL